MVEEHAGELVACFAALREAIVAQQQAGGAPANEPGRQAGEGAGQEVGRDATGSAAGVNEADGVLTGSNTGGVLNEHPAGGWARYTAWEHYEGVAALLVAHLLEMWALRLFGCQNIEEELRAIAVARPLTQAEGGERFGE
jgi:hypothetical protein